MIGDSTQRLWAIGGVGLALGLGLAPALAQDPPAPITTESAFLNWLRHPDSDEPPNSPRPGDNFCLVNLNSDTENLLWHPFPAFIIQGSPRSLSLYRDDANRPLWTYPVNQKETVVYNGPPLIPGVTYTLRAEHERFADTIYQERQLGLASVDDQVTVSFALAALNTELQQAGVSEVDRAIAQADYFWQQGFEADAWTTILPFRSTQLRIALALQAGNEKRCE